MLPVAELLSRMRLEPPASERNADHSLRPSSGRTRPTANSPVLTAKDLAGPGMMSIAAYISSKSPIISMLNRLAELRLRGNMLELAGAEKEGV